MLKTAAAFLALLLASTASHALPQAAPMAYLPGAPVTVGTAGNEPLIVTAPDGTLYISALQHLYRSTDQGLTWVKLPGPSLVGTVVASDSAMWVAPNGRLYFAFDYPYAGSTAACSSDDRGNTWACANAALPGVTDRMWIYAPNNTDVYLVTNEGLYVTTLAVSRDGGVTYTPNQYGLELQPQTGLLFSLPGSDELLQMVKVDTQMFYVFAKEPSPTAPTATLRPTGLGNTNALASSAVSTDNKIFIVGEEPNPAGGFQLIPAYSADAARTWKRLPAIPHTTTGSATFSWVAAGAPGHIGVIYYYTPDGVDPTVTTTSVWSAVWAETYNALDANPTWTITELEAGVHTGSVCAAAGCMGTARFAGDFINSAFDAAGNAHLTWQRETGGLLVRYARVPVRPPAQPDISPAPFAFNRIEGVAPGSTQVSNEITISDIDTAVLFHLGTTAAGGPPEYSLNDGPFTADAGQTLVNGDRLRLRHTASSTSQGQADTVLTIGGVSGTFTTITAVVEQALTPFSFIERSNVKLNTFITSEAVSLSGFTSALPISVSPGLQYSIDGGAFTTAAGSIRAGQKLAVRHVSANLENTTVESTVTVGSYSTPFRSITTTLDHVPEAFDFGRIDNVAPGTVVESSVQTLTAYDDAPVVAGAGLSYRINSGAWTTAHGKILAGQTLQVRHTANASSLGYTKSSITVGGVKGTFTTRTHK